MKKIINFLVASIMISFKYHSYWKFAEMAIKKAGRLEDVRRDYLDIQCCYIGSHAKFAAPPILPHGFHGIHISTGANIGKNVTIFQNVTIGSNTLCDSKRKGAPTIGDNVLVGAGAAIIGKVNIGDNCRIGANCIVVKDMPPNTVAVIGDIKFIERNTVLNNEFIPFKVSDNI